MYWRLRRLRTNTKTALHRRLRRKPLQIHRHPALISFCFDDFNVSAAAAGREILEDSGFCGTYYACLGLNGEIRSEEITFSPDDIPMLVERGHEVGCHTFRHRVLGDASASEIEREVADNAAAMDRLVPGYTLRTFAYPNGEVTLTAKRVLGAHFVSCRGTEGGINIGACDLALLRGTKIYSCRQDVPALRALIQENAQIGGWLIFYTHDVRAEPFRWGCTPEDFATVVRAAAASACDVLTVRDAIETLTTGP